MRLDAPPRLGRFGIGKFDSPPTKWPDVEIRSTQMHISPFVSAIHYEIISTKNMRSSGLFHLAEY